LIDKCFKKIVQFLTGQTTYVTGVFSVLPTTEAKTGHLEITAITKKEKTMWNRSKGKVMLQLFFYSSGNVHAENIPEGTTVNKRHYK
jgi:hypothetical protein